jgi:pseudaminic acid cytidylyltransferase
MKIAIVPARAGSKRIKNKNIKKFLGKPIILYTLKKIFNSKLFDKVIVSSNSKKILNICSEKFKIIKHQRNAKLSGDKSSTIDAINSCIKDQKLSSYDSVCCIYPCTPLLNILDLIKTELKLRLNNSKFVVPVIAFPHPIERALILKHNKIFPLENKKIEMRGQECQKTFHDAGQFYWAKVKTWLTSESILLNSVGYKMSQSNCIDINVCEDWKRAEQLFIIQEKNSKKL